MTATGEAPQWRTGRGSQTGCVRKHNEDRFHIDEHRRLWIVADGMGGHNAGEVASTIVVEHVARAVHDGDSVAGALRRANDIIVQKAHGTDRRRGMGSTAVVLRIDVDRYEIAWVGDSRAYRWDGQTLELLTRDHSLVQQLIDAGSITAEQAQSHPQRHLITRAVGMTGSVLEVEEVAGQVQGQDRFLLCSDGLSSELSEGEIADVLARSMSEQDAVDRLIEAALTKGGRDNVTALLVAHAAHDTHALAARPLARDRDRTP